jgi:hypothetical protein
MCDDDALPSLRRPYRVRWPFIDTIYHFGLMMTIRYAAYALFSRVYRRRRSPRGSNWHLDARQGSRNRIISC